MKELNMLVWLTQLGLSVALPLGGWIFLSLYLRQRFLLGSWIVILGFALGLLGAVSGFRQSLKILEKADQKNHQRPQPPVSFNDHE